MESEFLDRVKTDIHIFKLTVFDRSAISIVTRQLKLKILEPCDMATKIKNFGAI
jgi:hypothetical protein